MSDPISEKSLITSNERYVISEFYEFGASREMIMEAERTFQPIIMQGIMQKANVLNRNGRVYPKEILEREVNKYMESVKNKTATGELDHPENAIVSLSNVSHKVVDLWWEGDTLYGKVQIAETPAGQILKGLLKSDIQLGISSRGVGSVKEQGSKAIVQEDFELIAFDFVSSPSTPGAWLFRESRSMRPLKVGDEKYSVIVSKYDDLLDVQNNKFWKSL